MRRSQPSWQNEQGAVAVVVALMLVVFVGVGALAIDVGSGWATKRDLVIDLDAAALAGARQLAEEMAPEPPGTKCRPSGATSSTRAAVQAAVDEVHALNGGTADLEPITKDSIDCDRLTVTIEGTQDARTTFAGAVGDGELTAGGYAVAKAVEGVGGIVLPITFCSSVDLVSSWSNSATAPGTPGRIIYGDGPRDECGFAPGAWGWFGSSQQNTLRDWIENGYPGVITLEPECTGPAATSDGWCNGTTGARPNLLDHPNQTDLDGLSCSLPTAECPVYTIFIHTGLRGTGTNVDYEPTGFLDVVIRDAYGQGNTDDSWIDLEFIGFRNEPGEPATSPPTAFLCEVDGAPEGFAGCD